jgi:hypothetical protein
MNSSRSFQTVWSAAALACVLILTGRGQTTAGAPPLTIDDVVALSKAGIAEDVIVTKIRVNGKAFDLNNAEILELKKAGMSDLIVKVLMNPAYKPEPPAAPPTPSHPDTAPPPPPPPPPPLPAKHYPADDLASKVPPELGLYYFTAASPAKIGIKILLGMQGGAGLGKVVLKKPKTIAYLVGPAAESRIKDPAPIFYLRLPEGKPIEEVVLVVLDRKADRRELEMGAAGPKQAEVRRQFDYLEVGPSLFKLTTAKLGKGEYLFFQLGSAEPPKGIYGRGFDFGLDEPHK